MLTLSGLLLPEGASWISAARANPVEFTFTATDTSLSADGFVIGQSYQFSFTTSASFTASDYTGNNNGSLTGDLFYAGSSNFWAQGTKDPVFSSLALDASAAAITTSVSNLSNNTNNVVVLSASSGALPAFGVYTPNSSHQVNLIDASFQIPGTPNFAFPGTYTDPNAYWSAETGSYSNLTSDSYDSIYVQDTASNGIVFSVSALVISTIPEPSSYVAIFGVITLGCAVFRRRFRRDRHEKA